jgi:hypothetical protein
LLDVEQWAEIRRMAKVERRSPLKGDSYRLRDKDLGGPPPAERA